MTAQKVKSFVIDKSNWTALGVVATLLAVLVSIFFNPNTADHREFRAEIAACKSEIADKISRSEITSLTKELSDLNAQVASGATEMNELKEQIRDMLRTWGISPIVQQRKVDEYKHYKQTSRRGE